MLETSEERVKLLRLGFDSREIERLYVKHNKFKMVYAPHDIEIIEIDLPQNRKICPLESPLHTLVIDFVF